MAKTITPTAGQKRTLKEVKVYKRKHHGKLCTDRLDGLLSLCETKWNETKWNETKWKICTLRNGKICTLRNEKKTKEKMNH